MILKLFLVGLCFRMNLITCEEREYVKLNLNSKWEFQCPHVANVGRYKKIVVSWSLDEAIWLKIDGGNVTIINRLITFNRRQLGSSNVYTIVLNDFRYKYYYDEAVGDFSMTIQDTLREDSGLWHCQVSLVKTTGEVEELQAEAHILVGGAKPMKTPTSTQMIETTKVDSGQDFTISHEEFVSDEEQSSAVLNSTANSKLMNKKLSLFLVGVCTFYAFI